MNHASQKQAICRRIPGAAAMSFSEKLMSNQEQRVLVTGGAGFIGSHIVELLLKSGFQVDVIDNFTSGSKVNLPDGARLHIADIRDGRRVREIFDMVRPTLVCHQAAQVSVSRSVREPAIDAEINLIGLLNVLESATRSGVRRIVFASSGGVLYGNVDVPAAEDSPCQPISPYGISKWAGEKYLEFFALEHGFSAVALRYSNVYGPRQNPHGEAGVVAIFCNRFLAGEAAIINGDGGCVRDYVFVTDVARANLLALVRPLSTAFSAVNIGTSIGASVCEIEAAIRREHDKVAERPASLPDFGPPRAGDLRSNLISVGQAATLLDWRPEVELLDGIAQTYRWFAAMQS